MARFVVMALMMISYLPRIVLGSLLLAGLGGCQSADTTHATPAVSVSPAGTTVVTATDSAGVPTAIVSTLNQDALAAGHAIYTQRCAVCHGEDGRKGANGAHDLTKSNLNTTGRIYMVKNGLGKMPGFKDQLSDAEMEQVVAYSLTLTSD
ncbi:cytochrome c [Hymenobacter defluvii]|uniref:Cytochrome c n=2 Tax=Hymenobacter defluvii TaxID=2054411 RepID=A0ABS3T8P7_9BACT|nr:cytochrome c [Hymenobacter defluvii]